MERTVRLVADAETVEQAGLRQVRVLGHRGDDERALLAFSIGEDTVFCKAYPGC